jgi:hypothetical protein
MRCNSKFLLVCIVALSIGISQISFAAPGTGTTSPNPTGGFGQNTSTDPNPVGGFGTSTTEPDGFTPLSDPPPPPPDPVPLDGGMSLLLAATLGLGIKKIYSEVNKK